MWGKLIRIGGDETTQVASRFALTDDIVFFGRVSSITPDPGGQFSHKQQFAIPCVYVSSTHFSISVYYEPVSINNDVAAEGVKDTSNVSLQPHFRIQDFARNGTFLNGELIGMKNCKDLKEGDEISLRYKGKILIVYKFEGVSINVHEGPSAHEHLAQSSPTRRGSGTSQPTPNKQAAFQGQMSSATKNLLAESLAQQIVVLQEEAVVSNSRIAAQCQQIDHFHLELEKTHRKVKNEEKLREEAMKEVIELKEQITAMNSNQTALEARAKILHDENEELEKYVKDLKTKVNQLQDELKEKANQVEKRSNLLEDSNRALQEEQSHRQLVEAQLHDVQLLLDTSQVRAQNCELAIKDLQFINQELERKISEWVKQFDIQNNFIRELQAKYTEQIHKTSSICFQQYNTMIEVMKVFDQSMKSWHEQEGLMNSVIRDFDPPSAPNALKVDGLNANAKFNCLDSPGRLNSAIPLVFNSLHQTPSSVNIGCTQVPVSPDVVGAVDPEEELLPNISFNENTNLYTNGHISRRNNKRSNWTNQQTVVPSGGGAQKRGRLNEGTAFTSLMLDEEPIVPSNRDDDDNDPHEMVFECTQVPFSQVDDFQHFVEQRKTDEDCETMMNGQGDGEGNLHPEKHNVDGIRDDVLFFDQEEDNTALPLERTSSKVNQLEPPFKSEEFKGVSVGNVDYNLRSQESVIHNNRQINSNDKIKGIENDIKIVQGSRAISKQSESDDVEDDESLILTGQSKSKHRGIHLKGEIIKKAAVSSKLQSREQIENEDAVHFEDPILGNFDSTCDPSMIDE